MEHRSHITFTCPSCGHDRFEKGPDVKDHFLTQEVFRLYSCEACGLKKTEPIPSPEDLSKYYESDAYLSHGDQQKGLFAKLYRLAKSYNLGWKTRLLKNLSPDGRLLDYGCGTGDLIAHCQEHGLEVRGAEPSALAVENSPELVRGRIASPEEELNSDRAYEMISLWHVLEHIVEPTHLLESLRNKLTDDAHLIIAVPNHESLDAQHYGVHWAGWDVPRHLWHFAPNHIISLVESLGFDHIHTSPMWFDAFYVSMLSERYKGGGGAMGIVWGSISNLRALLDKKRRCSSQVYIFQRR